MNLDRYIYNLKVHSFVIKTFVQHMIKGVNKSRKMNLGLATLVLLGPITTPLNCFSVSILLLGKIIHIKLRYIIFFLNGVHYDILFICIGDLTNCLDSFASTSSDSPSEKPEMTTTQMPDG